MKQSVIGSIFPKKTTHSHTLSAIPHALETCHTLSKRWSLSPLLLNPGGKWHYMTSTTELQKVMLLLPCSFHFKSGRNHSWKFFSAMYWLLWDLHFVRKPKLAHMERSQQRPWAPVGWRDNDREKGRPAPYRIVLGLAFQLQPLLSPRTTPPRPFQIPDPQKLTESTKWWLLF